MKIITDTHRAYLNLSIFLMVSSFYGKYILEFKDSMGRHVGNLIIFVFCAFTSICCAIDIAKYMWNYPITLKKIK